MARNHKLFLPLKKQYTDEYQTEYQDAIWMPESIYISLLGDEFGNGRGVGFSYRAAKSAEHFDAYGKPFQSATALKNFRIENDDWDAVYQQNFPQLHALLQVMRNLAQDRIAGGDLDKFFADATLIDLE